jgi:hypothetical protein
LLRPSNFKKHEPRHTRSDGLIRDLRADPVRIGASRGIEAIVIRKMLTHVDDVASDELTGELEKPASSAFNRRRRYCPNASSKRVTKTSHSIVVRRIAASQNRQRTKRTTHALQKADK